MADRRRRPVPGGRRRPDRRGSSTATRRPTTTRTRSARRSATSRRTRSRRTPRRAASSRSADRPDQLHAQLGQGRRRRVRRHGHALRVGRDGPDPQGVGEGVPRLGAAEVDDPARRCWRTCATPRTCSRCSATSCRATTSPTPSRSTAAGLLEGPGDPTDDGNKPAAAAAVLRPVQMPGQTAPVVLADDDVRPPTTQTNLAAFIAVDADAGHRTTARSGAASCQRNTHDPRPAQVQNNFDSDSEVSTAAGDCCAAKGSTVSYGNLLTLPVGGGLLYVEPVYTQRVDRAGVVPAAAERAGRPSARRSASRTRLDDALVEAFAGTVAPGNGNSGGDGTARSPAAATTRR